MSLGSGVYSGAGRFWGVGSADLEMWANMGRVGIRARLRWGLEEPGPQDWENWAPGLQDKDLGLPGIVCIRATICVHKPSLPTGEVLAQAHPFLSESASQWAPGVNA